MMQLLQYFNASGFEITFSSPASTTDWSEDLSELVARTTTIELNNASFDDFVKELGPDLVVFDRYITEEQFGWRVAAQCPNAIRILDTEDLHFLRKAREEAVTLSRPVFEAELFSETAKREIASILRCDLSLIISEFELNLLTGTFQVPKGLLFYLPFLVDAASELHKGSRPGFRDRKDFVTVGNFLHQPNSDSVRWLKSEIWPRIRKALPEAELHIFGNYAAQSIQQFHNEQEGFLMEGWAPSVESVMKHARVCLAPLRFGAGLKGKLFDAMYWGTPSVTTQVGAEGIATSLDYPGFVADSAEEIADRAFSLHTQELLWVSSQTKGDTLLDNRFQKAHFIRSLNKRLEKLFCELDTHRKQHFIGQVLLHNSQLATRYLSKWIEEKNR